jgi:hypothetical protein
MRPALAPPFVALVMMVLGCEGAAPTPSPYQEIYAAGLTKYSGTAIVQPSSITNEAPFPSVRVHHFTALSSERGPLCMSGSEFYVETRDGSSSELLVFLEEGGLCLSEVCMATADATLSLRALMVSGFLGVGGVLSSMDRENPLAEFNVVHVPSCDGAMFVGDVDRLLAVNGVKSMAYQRGLQNLTAAFEVAKSRYPNPSRLVLAGAGGGAYAMVLGLALARHYYPGTEIAIISDSGGPILRDHDKAFAGRALAEVNALQYVPTSSCADCIENGHFTKMFAWALDRDPNFRVAFMIHADDLISADILMKSPPPIFRLALLRELASLDGYGSRVHRFITVGRGHTYLFNVPMMDHLMDTAGDALDGINSMASALDPAILLSILSNPSTALDPKTLISLLSGPLSKALDPTTLLSFLSRAFDPKTILESLSGPLSKAELDEAGKPVTGYHWLEEFLRSPDTLVDVVNVMKAK